MEKCLKDAGRMLQEEVDKHVGVESGEQSENNPIDAKTDDSNKKPLPPEAIAFGDVDPDGMMAAFFAKQQAAKNATEKLPVEDWAPNIVALSKKHEINPVSSTSTVDVSDSEKQLIDRLWNIFSLFQEF